MDNGKLTFVAANETRHANAMSGTVRALVANMVNGVSKGFERKLTLVGVGYRASIKATPLSCSSVSRTTFCTSCRPASRPNAPPRRKSSSRAPTSRSSAVAAELRAYREPEPYKGKGVRYSDERVVIKETKKK